MPAPAAILAIPIIEGFLQAVRMGAVVERGRQQAAMLSEILETERGMRVDLIDALVNRRVDVLHKSFEAVLQIHADQSRAMNERLGRMLDLQLASTDALQRAELERSALNLQLEVRQLNADIARLFTRMSEVLMMIGKDVTHMPELQRPTVMPALELLR